MNCLLLPTMAAEASNCPTQLAHCWLANWLEFPEQSTSLLAVAALSHAAVLKLAAVQLQQQLFQDDATEALFCHANLNQRNLRKNCHSLHFKRRKCDPMISKCRMLTRKISNRCNFAQLEKSNLLSTIIGVPVPPLAKIRFAFRRSDDVPAISRKR